MEKRIELEIYSELGRRVNLRKRERKKEGDRGETTTRRGEGEKRGG